MLCSVRGDFDSISVQYISRKNGNLCIFHINIQVDVVQGRGFDDITVKYITIS